MLKEWALAWIAGAGSPFRARKHVLAGPNAAAWHSYLDGGNEHSRDVWAGRAKRLTAAARKARLIEVSAAPQYSTPSTRPTPHENDTPTDTPDRPRHGVSGLPKTTAALERRDMAHVALAPGIVADVLSAGKVLSRLTEFALGIAPELVGLEEQKGGQAAKARLVLDALGKLSAILGVGPNEGTGAESASARRWKLRQRLLAMPPALRDQLRDAVAEVFQE